MDDLARKKRDDAAHRLGLASPDDLKLIVPGAVFHATDAAIGIPTERLPGSGERTEHSRRRVIVMQSEALNRSASLKTVLVVPCTASHRTWPPAPWDFAIPENEEAFSKERVVALASIAQPILKSELHHCTGNLSPDALQGLRKVMLNNGGLLPQQSIKMPPRP